MNSPTSPTVRRLIQSDICIVGNGAIAKTTALAFSQAGQSVTMLSPTTPAASAPAGDPGWDVRVYALNHTAHDLLCALKVWGALDAARVAPVDEMLVNGDGAHAGGLAFDAYGAHTGTLAWIVEDRNLNQALDAALNSPPTCSWSAAAPPAWYATPTAPPCTSTTPPSAPRWLSVPTAPSPGCAASATSASITAPMARAPWSATSLASCRTTALPTSGSPAPRASSRCCRCLAIWCRWCGRRPTCWPPRCAASRPTSWPHAWPPTPARNWARSRRCGRSWCAISRW